MKRNFCLFLVVAIVLCFFGCQDAENKDGAVTTQVTTSATTTQIVTTTSSTTQSTSITTTAVQTTVASTTNSEKNWPQETGFYQGYLCVNLDGNVLIYEEDRMYDPYEDPLTPKEQSLAMFETETHMEGIIWDVLPFEEYPDLSYVLLASGTNIFVVYRIVDNNG